jgi:PAS domain S-box-containing protein
MPVKRPSTSKRAPRARRRRRGKACPPVTQAWLERRIGELELEATRSHLKERELHEALSEMQAHCDHYSRLFNLVPVGTVLVSGSGIIRDINEAGAALLGRQRSELINESFARFIARDSLERFLSHLRSSKLVREPLTTEVALRSPLGLLVPVELIGSVSDGGPRQDRLHRIAMVNISERRQAEAALAETQRHYRTLIHSMQGVVWEGNPRTGEFTFVSQQAERLLGYPVEYWLRDPEFFADHLHPDDRERVIHQRELARVPGRSFETEFRMFTATDQVMWLRDNVTILRGEDGQISLQGVMVNVTELKTTVQALREEKRALETLHRIGTSLAAELDITKLVEEVTEAGKQVTGAKFAAFSYKQINGAGGTGEFVLHASGAPPETFRRLPQPEHDPAMPRRETESEVIRIEDIAQRHSLKSHGRSRSKQPRVRSYLAVPVISRSGETLGGLLFGHPEPGVFTERAQHLITGIAAEAGIALDNARLYHAAVKSEAHFRELAEAMPQIVWTAGPDGGFQYFNSRWFTYTGQRERSQTKDWTAYLAGEHPEACIAAWEESIQSGQPLQLECRLRGRDSPEGRWHLVRAEPIRDAAGRIARWFGTCTDIEQQKRSEQEVRDLNAALEKRVEERTAQLEASNRELEAFCYSVSHDLRAPLRSIDAFSQLVREDYGAKLDAQGHQYLNTVAEASRQMARLIDDLLHLSRVTRIEMYRQPVSLTALAEHVVAGFRQLEPRRQVEIKIAPDLMASGDERLLRIVLDNLLSNAWKFTGKKPSARIEFGVQEWTGEGVANANGNGNGNGVNVGAGAGAGKVRAGERVFFVRDDGAGFDMQYAGKLFGAFQRLHSGDDFPGHGVGLATVQRIVNRHGGQIWAQSALGEGATFYFTLPEAG